MSLVDVVVEFEGIEEFEDRGSSALLQAVILNKIDKQRNKQNIFLLFNFFASLAFKNLIILKNLKCKIGSIITCIKD